MENDILTEKQFKHRANMLYIADLSLANKESLDQIIKSHKALQEENKKSNVLNISNLEDLKTKFRKKPLDENEIFALFIKLEIATEALDHIAAHNLYPAGIALRALEKVR